MAEPRSPQTATPGRSSGCPPEGRAKILDFGLAKAYRGDGGSADSAKELSQSPTLPLSDTRAGVVFGTVGYVAPEQASGKKVDKQADIWAFGVVLFEMLTGRPLFGGESVPEVVAPVLKEELATRLTSDPARALLE
jgi:serine/threonine protein kinase